MQRHVAAAALLALWCTACATLGMTPADIRLEEAQEAFDEGQRLKESGQYAEAIPLIQRALELRENLQAGPHPKVANCLDLLGALHLLLADYARAEPLLVRALQLRQAALGEHHPDVASSLNNLATLYYSQGLYERAEPLYTRALRIWQAALGSHHPDIVSVLNNLASLYNTQGFYARAEPLYARALEIREAALGEEHPNVATSLQNLASLYMAQGQYTRAEPLYLRALQIREAALGEGHPDVASTLNNLANLYFSQGLYARAEPLYARALRIREALLGPNHPDVVTSLYNLAHLHLAQQNLDAALPLLERAFTASEQHLRQEVFGFSEKRLATFLRLLRDKEEFLYALVRAYPQDPRVLHLALSATLLRKDRSILEVANTSLIINRNLAPADRENFRRLRTLRTQLATLSLAGSGAQAAKDTPQRLKELSDEAETLEADLARRSEPLRRLRMLPPPTQLISRVTEALPTNSALIEFVAYQHRPLLPRTGFPPSPEDAPLHYLALLLFPDGRTRAVDLGPAEPIDRAALSLHDALARQALSYESAAQALYELAFRPLLPHLGEVRRLFLTPDGQLNLVPFAALHDGHHFLVEDFQITYLTSGKDLLPRPEGLPPAHSMVVLAAPELNAPPEVPLTQAHTAPALATRARAVISPFAARRAREDDVAWPPLPGTRAEAEAIHSMFPQAQLLLGPAATKQALLNLSAPGLLHIATHAFFLEELPPTQASRAVVLFGAGGAGAEARPIDPLLRSGLVLAGDPIPAAAPDAPPSHYSWVTALEVAGMDLWGTQLVVLSACETGRGDIQPGQGVYGLRRAFLAAGAETLVTSLWKVNDASTQQLMASYYRHLLAGHGRTAALREAMLELRQMHPHPHFWAPFTVLGLDTPLQGLEPSADKNPA